MKSEEILDAAWETPPSVIGLDAASADLPALDVLSAIPWDGVEFDPETTPAELFLTSVW